jgi:hypothetical protein
MQLSRVFCVIEHRPSVSRQLMSIVRTDHPSPGILVSYFSPQLAILRSFRVDQHQSGFLQILAVKNYLSSAVSVSEWDANLPKQSAGLRWHPEQRAYRMFRLCYHRYRSERAFGFWRGLAAEH